MTKKTVEQFEKTLAVLGLVSSRIRKTSSSEINEIVGGTPRGCCSFIQQLVKSGYLVSDGKKPAGYKATEKAKKIFYKN